MHVGPRLDMRAEVKRRDFFTFSKIVHEKQRRDALSFWKGMISSEVADKEKVQAPEAPEMPTL